jgi:UDP-N-acetylmuramate--alanine ligase
LVIAYVYYSRYGYNKQADILAIIMHIYLSGIGGVGIGPLAQIALDAGYKVSGSDLSESHSTAALLKRGADVAIRQDGTHIKTVNEKDPIDWFVYTAALPDDHIELTYAREHGIRTSKRDELLATILQKKNIKLVAVAGTHGKTTTTAMLVWVAQQLGMPVSYLVGSSMSFAPSGKLDQQSEYFFYECDEYDRNFLHFNPYLSIFTSIDYDHPDTYPTEDDYKDAFLQFTSQSEAIIAWQSDVCYITGQSDVSHLFESINQKHIQSQLNTVALCDDKTYRPLSHIKLAGQHNRKNAALALTALLYVTKGSLEPEEIPQQMYDAMNAFPSSGRRFEKLADNIYSDYGHHPREIVTTLQMAREMSDHVVLVYQPHQNSRQHHVKDDYVDAFVDAEKIYWLPTYLTREDPSLRTIEPAEFVASLSNSDKAEVVEMNNELWQKVLAAQNAGKLVLLMGAGTIDSWVRSKLGQS